MNKLKDTMEVNPYTTINNLYTLYGKKCVENEALCNTIKMFIQETKALKKEVKKQSEKIDELTLDLINTAGESNGNTESD